MGNQRHWVRPVQSSLSDTHLGWNFHAAWPESGMPAIKEPVRSVPGWNQRRVETQRRRLTPRVVQYAYLYFLVTRIRRAHLIAILKLLRSPQFANRFKTVLWCVVNTQCVVIYEYPSIHRHDLNQI
jgi:hypothetical protein